MKKIAALAALSLIYAPFRAVADSGPTADQIKAVLQANPNIVLDVLRQNKEAFFAVVKQAAQEDQIREEKERAEAEKKQVADAIKNPFKPIIDASSNIDGNSNAKYTLVEYADFQCPACGMAYPTVEALRKEYGKDMRYVFKPMPLVEIHPQAMPSATYFEAISLQSPDKAWQFYNELFNNQNKLSEDFYKDTARKLGVDMTRLEKDLTNPEVSKRISNSMAEFQNFGIFGGTPGFFINGVPVYGAYPQSYFEDIIKKIDAAHSKG